MGVRGRGYVARQYGSEQAFAARLLAAIDDLQVPLSERMAAGAAWSGRRKAAARAGVNASARSWNGAGYARRGPYATALRRFPIATIRPCRPERGRRWPRCVFTTRATFPCWRKARHAPWCVARSLTQTAGPSPGSVAHLSGLLLPGAALTEPSQKKKKKKKKKKTIANC